MNDILVSASRQAARPGTSMASSKVSRQPADAASLRNLIATWRRRIRSRRELEEKLKTAPHLIDDIGLTKPQVEAELAKPFWQE